MLFNLCPAACYEGEQLGGVQSAKSSDLPPSPLLSPPSSTYTSQPTPTLSITSLQDVQCTPSSPSPSLAPAMNTIDANVLAARIEQQRYHLMETPPTSPANQVVTASDDPHLQAPA